MRHVNEREQTSKRTQLERTARKISFTKSIEGVAGNKGFRGKRALGILLKSELCKKHSKFGMQICLEH